MDKLQPLIVHRFWIITSLSLILSLVGWSVGTGTLEQRFVEKEGTIKGAFSSLEPLGSTTPNDGWIKGLELANMKEQAALDRSAKTLSEKQQPLMYWPRDIHEQMKQYPYMSKKIDIKLRRKYREVSYGYELERLWRSLDPFNIENGKGTIQAHRSVIPHLPPFEAAPSATVMWTSMEDIWLLKGLFRAIRSVNYGARTLANSPIVMLSKVELRGGRGTDKWHTGGQGVEGYGDQRGGGCGDDLDSSMGNQGMSGYGGCGDREGSEEGFGGGFEGSGNVDIDLSKDVGSDALSSGGSGEGFSGEGFSGEGSTGDTDGCNDEVAAAGGCRDEAGDGGYGFQGAGQQGKRYVDDDPDLKFKTRAFKLSLLMHVDKVPDLLAALNNISWPVRILRVHQRSRSPEFAGSVGGLGGNSSANGGFGG
ncbi:MAG: hypothetical protein IH899_08505, partial [Planctomycetes bacterium]|nr:hypothetical protein [Planctomycetota bacterium]